jgi:hypothetical protein
MTVTTPGGSVSVVRLHRLTMVPEDDGVMVGRSDIASYAMFPEEGAQVLRMLDSGVPIYDAAAWYEQTCGTPLDFDDFLEVLAELQFLLGDDEDRPAEAPIRWQRLGGWVFSWPAWLCYLALITAAIIAMVSRSSLRPSYHDVFFTSYLVLIPVTVTVVQIPYILLHEGFHALAGRRLGLPSTLGISRRFVYLVAETRLDSLFSVPRRRRYLPFCAGILADVVAVSGLTLLSAALDGHGIPRWCPALCLAMAFTCVLRMVWQLMFYLETDLYFVITNAFHCSDLQQATRYYLKLRSCRLLRRELPEPDADWSERDRAMARWYAPILVAGYGFSLGSLAWAGIPTMAHFVSLIADRLRGAGTPLSGLLDAVSFIVLMSLQIGLLSYVNLRDRRARKASLQAQGALE